MQLPHWVDPGADTRVELIGTDAGDVLRASACHVVLRGRGGDDHLRVGVDGDELDPLLRPLPPHPRVRPDVGGVRRVR